MVLRKQHEKSWAEKIKAAPGLSRLTGGKQSYPVRLLIYKAYGDPGWTEDRGARMTYEDREVYELESDGTETKPVPYEKLMHGPDGNPMAVLYSPEKGVYHPMAVNDEDYAFDVDEGNWIQWASQSLRQRHEQWKTESGGLLSHPAAPHVALGILVFLMLIGFAYYMENGVGFMADAVKSVGQTATNVR